MNFNSRLVAISTLFICFSGSRAGAKPPHDAVGLNCDTFTPADMIGKRFDPRLFGREEGGDWLWFPFNEKPPVLGVDAVTVCGKRLFVLYRRLKHTDKIAVDAIERPETKKGNILVVGTCGFETTGKSDMELFGVIPSDKAQSRPVAVWRANHKNQKIEKVPSEGTICLALR